MGRSIKRILSYKVSHVHYITERQSQRVPQKWNLPIFGLIFLGIWPFIYFFILFISFHLAICLFKERVCMGRLLLFISTIHFFFSLECLLIVLDFLYESLNTLDFYWKVCIFFYSGRVPQFCPLASLLIFSLLLAIKIYISNSPSYIQISLCHFYQ